MRLKRPRGRGDGRATVPARVLSNAPDRSAEGFFAVPRWVDDHVRARPIPDHPPEAGDALRRGEVTSVELTEACLAAIDSADALGAFVHKTPEIAIERARAADARIKAGDAPDMCGIPVGIKDLFCTEGVPSQAASKDPRGLPPRNTNPPSRASCATRAR